MLPALLHSIAFAICLFVQMTGSPLAGAWVLFHTAGCAALLYGGTYEKSHGFVWYVALAWLIALGASTFLMAPVRGGAATMAVLAAMPTLALCLRKEHLKPYATGFLAVATVYAVGLVLQMALNTETEFFNYPGRHAWPLLDPNNAAAVITVFLLPCIWAALFVNASWAGLCALFIAALVATGSKAGFCAAGLGLFVMLGVRLGLDFVIASAALVAVCAVGIFFRRPDLIVTLAHSFADRFPIWEASWPLLGLRPLLGLGLGTFGFYYAQVRTEQFTVGWHSHNDVLQIAIEAGIPAATLFCLLLAAVAFTTRRANLASGCAILGAGLMSMVEFQFYIPAVSLPLGLALGWHTLTTRKARP